MAATDVDTPSAAVDVVAVLDSDLNQVFELARPVKALVKEESKAMDHPLETGATIIDHRIILPVEIELSFVLNSEEFAEVYQQVRTFFLNAELFTIQTRTGSYPSMLIAGMPHDETPDMADATTLAVSFKEAQFVEPEFSDLKVAQPAASNTVKRGEQQPKTSTQEPRKGSILSGIFR